MNTVIALVRPKNIMVYARVKPRVRQHYEHRWFWLDLSVGYHQIKSVPTMLVILSYSWLTPRAYTITSLVWPMLSPCSHDGGSPVIWKFRWVVVESIDNILISSMMLLNIKLVLETFESIFFMLAHEVLVWWKEWLPLIHVHFDVSCRREFEKACFYLLRNRPKSVMHVRRILWSVRLIIFIPYVYPSTPSHWLTCSRKRSLCLGSNPWTCVKTSISSMMAPNQNSVVFYCKITMWACLSGTTCSHVCSRTSSCFGACYRSSSSENPATSSRRFVLQTFIFLPRLDESGISWHQPDLSLRQIWWLEYFPRTIILVPR